jgi:hypothetical protein
MSDNNSETFIELCLKGRATIDDVDGFVDRWHAGSDGVSLRDFLGLSETEYSLWINDPDVLPYVIYSRRERRPFAQVVNDNYYDDSQLAARPDQSHKMRTLREWLQSQGYRARPPNPV